MFPMLLILVIGATFGGGFVPNVAVVGPDDGRAADIKMGLAAVDDIETVDFESRADALDSVERGQVNAAIVMPDTYDATIAAGEPVQIEFLARQDDLAQQLRSVVEAVVSDQAARLGAAQTISELGEVPLDESEALVTAAVPFAGGVTVTTETLGEAFIEGNLGRFDLGAAQQLLLFTFLTSLAGSAALIQTRQWGVSRRMLSTPTSTRSILLGETLGRLGVALVQSIFIMLGALAVFGVNWGDPVAAIALVVMFSVVGSGAGLLMGSLFSNDQQAGSLGVFVGLGFAALGGCMVPIELFSSTMQTVAHITPHAWALDGFAELVRRGGTIADIGTELGVLAVFAVVLLSIATLRLRTVLTT